MKTRRILWITLMLAAILIPGAMAFAKELGAMEISGPGISGTLRLDDQDSLIDLQEGGFFDSTQRITMTDEQISGLGEGYQMLLYLDMGEPEMLKAQEIVYYADPEGGAGYMHWLPRGSAEMVMVESEQWSRVRGGEDLFQSMMLAAGVDVKAAALPAPVVVEQPAADTVKAANAASQPEVAPAVTSEPAAAPMPWGWIGGSLAVIALLAAAWVLRQRTTAKLEPASASQD